MSQWTVVASGPSGRNLTDENLVGRVICVNTSIKWQPLENVHYYFFRHGNEYRMFRDLLERGIKLVAFKRANPGQSWQPDLPRGKPIPWWLSHVEQLEWTTNGWDPHAPVPTQPPWKLGEYSQAIDPIGPSAVQYALNAGATSVHMYGLEGGWADKMSYDQKDKRAIHCSHYHKAILQACIDACPDVDFIHYGDPLFVLEGDNITHE